jgi:hypothetical protein
MDKQILGDFWLYLTADMEPEEQVYYFSWRCSCTECDHGWMIYRGWLPTFGGAQYECSHCNASEWFLEGEE